MLDHHFTNTKVVVVDVGDDPHLRGHRQNGTNGFRQIIPISHLIVLGFHGSFPEHPTGPRVPSGEAGGYFLTRPAFRISLPIASTSCLAKARTGSLHRFMCKECPDNTCKPRFESAHLEGARGKPWTTVVLSVTISCFF